MRAAIEELGFKPAHIFDMEPDAGLGNGGLGRLAAWRSLSTIACFMESLVIFSI